MFTLILFHRQFKL